MHLLFSEVKLDQLSSKNKRTQVRAPTGKLKLCQQVNK